MTTNLIARLAKASAEVGGKLKADKRNSEQGYAYVSADKILAVCGQALSDNGIMIIPSIVKQELHQTERQGKSPRQDALVEFVMTITDGETSMTSSWFGMGSDYMTPDKALYKAITSGHKYFISKLFAIGEGNEDSEHDSGDDEKKPAPVKLQPDRKPEPAAVQVANSWPKATIDAVVDRYKIDRTRAVNTLNLTGFSYEAKPADLFEWIDEYRTFRNQAGENGKPLYTPEQAAEMTNEARMMRAEIAANGE